ncbi:MAG: sulfatase-like hydrolase/transferase [Lachnospiraceae bacterium]|nr:sulfatase-like hydrolase/transferase [Lachnospiraceae bacterium]MCI9203674.1 sulfatase-like hydrolase/transferase [Lachnospiraceae bacterium]
MKRKNILWVLRDQFWFDALSVLGHPVVETPNLDALAREGVLFKHAYSSGPSYIPARAEKM